MSEQVLTDEQQTIVNAARGKDNILIEAIAGSGKTFALVKALEVIPQPSILVCAYNNRIAAELKARAPKPRPRQAIYIKTFHAIGREILLAHHPRLQFDRSGTEQIIDKALQGRGLSYPQRRSAVRLLRQFKEIEIADGIGVADVEELESVGHTYDLFGTLGVTAIDTVIEVVQTAYQLSHEPQNLTTVDFCDMIWMPIALGLTPRSRYQALVVDEWQDINEPQLELLRKLCAPTSRLIMAGDGKQAINAWRGAVADTVRSFMIDTRKAKVLTLTTSFRCSKAVINEAQALVPNIKSWDQALEGSITRCGLNDVPRMIYARPSDVAHTFILSRANGPLLDTALYLWREGVRFQLNAGQEMLAPLFDLLKLLDLRTPDLFRKTLNTWHTEQSAKLANSASVELQERLDEQRSMLLSAVSYVAPSGLHKLFNTILEPGNTGVLLSTVHKVKGLEADRVFLLRETFKRHRVVDDPNPGALNTAHSYNRLKPPTEEDLNIEYVAITRAREHLIWVSIDNRSTAAPDLTADLLASMTIENLEAEYIKADGEFQRIASLGDNALADQWAEHAKAILAELKGRPPL